MKLYQYQMEIQTIQLPIHKNEENENLNKLWDMQFINKKTIT